MPGPRKGLVTRLDWQVQAAPLANVVQAFYAHRTAQYPEQAFNDERQCQELRWHPWVP